MGTKLMLVASIALIYAAYYFRPDGFDPEKQIRGRRVLITGASSGIGEQLAYQYARLGAHVVVTARREPHLQKVVSKCRELGAPGATFGYVVADMSNMSHPEIVVKTAYETLGQLDYVIVNHAYLPKAAAWDASSDNVWNLHTAIDVNVKSSALLLAHALPHLIATKGNVGVVNSMMGKICRPLFTTYCASKFALDGFIQGLRVEMRDKEVQFTNCVLGLIGTQAARDIVDEMKQTRRVDESKLKTAFADPEECAFEILKATALGWKDMYFPSNQYLWLKTALRDLIVKLDILQVPEQKEGSS